jgi:acyl carrier protein
MISESDVRDILSDVLKSHRPHSWSNDYRFLGDALDSLDHAAFVLELQEKRGLFVPDEDMHHLDTIENVVSYAKSRLE